LRVGPGADVFFAPTDGSAAPTRLTETPEKTVISAWTHASRAVIVEQDHDGNERTQFFRVDLERPGVMAPLSEPDPPYFPRGGRLHPNGRWFVYGANYDFAAGREIEQTWVYRHDLETGERLVLARPLKNAWNLPVLNDQGTHVLYGRKDLDPSGYQLWMTDIEGREDREIVNAGARQSLGNWFQDGAACW
jgi:hypothetical protein